MSSLGLLTVDVWLTFELAGLLFVAFALLLTLSLRETQLLLLRLAAHAQVVLIAEPSFFIASLLLNELLDEGDLAARAGIHGVTGHHVVRQRHYDLTVSHLFVVEGVHLGEQRLDLRLVLQHIHDAEQLFELDFADHAVLITVDRLEEIGEFDEEALVFLELEVKDDLSKVGVE